MDCCFVLSIYNGLAFTYANTCSEIEEIQRVGSLRPLSLRFFDRILKSNFGFLCKFKPYILNLILKRLDLGMKQPVDGSSMRISLSKN